MQDAGPHDIAAALAVSEVSEIWSISRNVMATKFQSELENGKVAIGYSRPCVWQGGKPWFPTPSPSSLAHGVSDAEGSIFDFVNQILTEKNIGGLLRIAAVSRQGAERFRTSS